ncbi:MAG: MFS transporter [Gemmatales bacterium]|nr:MFS transporter [Gemmatales bacterium]MDW8175940.1 MFS transporter [Gemmatales bacterium]
MKTVWPGSWSGWQRTTALGMLVLINMFNYIDRYLVAAVEPQMAESFFPPDQPQELVKTRMGLLMPAFMVSYMVVAPLFGWLGDRYSRWWLIALGIALWSLASGGSGLASSYLMLFVTRCLVGVGEGAYGPVAPTVIADLYPVAQRGRALSLFYAAIPVGSALGYLLSGVMLWWTNNWRTAFYAVLPPGLLLAVLCLFFPEPQRGQVDQAEKSNLDSAAPSDRKVTWRDYALLARIPSYVLCTLGMTAMTFAVGGIAFWMPRYLSEDRNAGSLDQVNIIFGIIIAATGLLATLAGGWMGDTLRNRWRGAYFLVSALGMFVALPLFIAALWLPFPWAWGLLAGSCFCLFMNTGPTNAILANVTHPAIRATAFAINIFVIHALGDVLSPAVIGFIADHSSLEVGFLVVAGFIAFGGLLWFLGARFLDTDTKLAVPRLEQFHQRPDQP